MREQGEKEEPPEGFTNYVLMKKCVKCGQVNFLKFKRCAFCAHIFYQEASDDEEKKLMEGD